MKPPLNWREIAQIAEWIAPEASGMFVDRIIVPARPEFPDGYRKHEWAIRLTSRGKESTFLFSISPGNPGLDWIDGKGPRAATTATRSGFDLTLNKALSGRKIISVSAIERERTLLIRFEGELTLVLTLIPALPEALLIDGALKILARSRTSKSEIELYTFPTGAGSPPNLSLRPGVFDSLIDYSRAVRVVLDFEAFELRVSRIRARISQDLKLSKTRLSQNEKTAASARSESDFRYLGDLLKSSMGTNPPLLEDGTREVQDWETGASTRIKCDPKLSLKEQVEKFYSLAKRKERRILEADLRLNTFAEKYATLAKLRIELDRMTKLSELPPLEAKLGLSVGSPESGESKAIQGKGASGKGRWSGKTFRSREGLPILVGRSKDENLELTFKFARGNDLWMHVRGKPGAHVLIPLREKKNASLETLLDAAYLCLHYSGGAEWGKTEIDYAAKKHVKRIRDSSEASYVNNKTLIIELDRGRLHELLGQEIV